MDKYKENNTETHDIQTTEMESREKQSYVKRQFRDGVLLQRQHV